MDTDTRRTMLVGGLLSAVTLAVFWPVRHHDFIIYDDQVYVVSNAAVRRGLTWAGAAWAFTTFHAANWHPLTWLSHMLDCQLYGLHPGGHHLTSLLLHSANAGLLFVALKRLTGALGRSALVAALFALHPLHVESFAWIAERKDVLSGFFFILTLWAYARYAEGGREKAESRKQKAENGSQNPATRDTRHATRFTFHVSLCYLLSLFFFTLGLMSKPMLVTLPFVLLLLDYWPLGRLSFPPLQPSPTPPLRLVWEKLPFLALSALSCVVTCLAQSSGGAVDTLARVPLDARLANAAVAYLGYLEKMVWPTRLSILYLRPRHWPPGRVGLAVLVLAGISVLVLVVNLVRTRSTASLTSPGMNGTRWNASLPTPKTSSGAGWLTVGSLWFLGMLVPVSGLMQVGNQYMADRYSYLPLIGLFIIVAWGGWELAGRLAVRRACPGGDASPRRPPRPEDGRFGETSLPRSGGIESLTLPWAATAALLVLIAAGVVAVRQVGFWQNSETIFGHCLAVTPNNHVAHNNLGAALAQQGRTEEARAQFMAAWRVQPHDADTLYNVGLLLADQGKFEEGAPYLAEAVGTKPELGSIYGKLGMILDTRGRTAQAIACYREGMRLRPGQVDMANNLAWILATTPDSRLRDGNEAVRLAERACESSGYKQAVMVGTLAAAYAEAGRFPQAVTAAEQAIALATAASQPGLAERNRQLMELYRAGKPFREPKNGS